MGSWLEILSSRKELSAVLPWLILAVPGLAVALGAGLTRPFFQVYDCDLYYIYNALRFNQGLPQISFDHTGYTYSLLLSWWTLLLHGLGLLRAVTLETVRAAADPTAALAALVVAGRVLSILLALLFAAIMAKAAIRLSGDRVVGLALGLVVAAAPGTSLHAMVLRPELLSAMMVMIAFVAIALSRDAISSRGFIWLAVAAAGAYLAVLTKMQAIIPVLGLPVFGLLWGRRERDEPESALDRAHGYVVLLAAVVVFLPFATSHYFGAVTILDQRPPPAYSWAVVGYVFLATVAYARLYRKTHLFFVRSLAALLIGFGLAFAVNAFHFSLDNPGWNAAFIDGLKRFAVGGFSTMGSDGTEGVIQVVERAPELFGSALHSFFWANPLLGIGRLVFFLMASALAFLSARNGGKREALALGVLIAVALGTVCVFGLRGFRSEYDVYLYFLVGLAIAMGFAVLIPPRDKVRPLLVGACVLVAVVHMAASYRLLVVTPYATGYRTISQFCQWQGTTAPIFAPEVYNGNKCWPLYAKGLPENPGFAIPTSD